MVDTQLGKHAYVASDTFSLADICLGVHVHRWLNLPVEGRPELPNLLPLHSSSGNTVQTRQRRRRPCCRAWEPGPVTKQYWF